MSKCIQNYTEDELRELLPNIPYDRIHIVYEYYHKSKLITAENFANKYFISKSTLFRYVKEIKKGLLE